MNKHALSHRLSAEALGSFFLFAGVLGSGVMAQTLAGGNLAVALLANTVATSAILYVLIEMFGPISGAHFNPAVTLAFAIRREFAWRDVAPYVLVQIAAGAIGAFAVHLMFDLPILQFSGRERAGIGQWTGELVATFGLVLAILVMLRHRPGVVPAVVALYIGAAYWFTSSTSFANPAITIVRSLSDTFAGIAPADVPGFIAAQLAGMLLAVGCARLLLGRSES
ncbi:MIP/aquaporin family protein [Alteraurantiacibacter aestuarii]|uniref:Aquaporin family protein n=1 Tax=Alteraurantiacibacter aestuarii TaxID=650004 RepID=A0A844ZJ20_9SPHN|nr:MIP/aquaporin family protein [Alteraurantiacibacter aestuarii]MXO87146.1 aquaporin family protein [Alteraurantiacibacter aestuarii]